MSGNPEQGYTLTWAFHTYWDAISDYKEQFGRSIVYAGDRDAAVPDHRVPAGLLRGVPRRAAGRA